MAKDTQAIKGIPLNPEGMNDNSPLNDQPTWYQTRGVHSLDEKCLQRITGKLLIEKFDDPVLAIHAIEGNVYLVETTTALTMYNIF